MSANMIFWFSLFLSMGERERKKQIWKVFGTMTILFILFLIFFCILQHVQQGKALSKYFDP